LGNFEKDANSAAATVWLMLNVSEGSLHATVAERNAANEHGVAAGK
jgi:hypothetical protein